MNALAVSVANASQHTRYRWRIASWVLLLAILCTALAVVYSTHRTRQTFVILETLRATEISLQEEWYKLLLEQSALSAHARIEKIARLELGMRPLSEPGQAIVP